MVTSTADDPSRGSNGPDGVSLPDGSFCAVDSPFLAAPTIPPSEYALASNASTRSLSCESKFGYFGGDFSAIGGA